MEKREKEEAQRAALYAEVLKVYKMETYEKGIKICNKILHDYPNEVLAFESKIFCLIDSDGFKEAIDCIEKNKKFNVKMMYEKAYCYYRLQEMEKAKEVLDNWNEDTFAKKELMVQILYRLDKFEEAYDLLKEVIKTSDDDMDDERQTNLTAIVAALHLAQSKKTVPAITAEGYEAQYNLACAYIGQGRIREAEVVLLNVEKLALERLKGDEDVTDEDVADELGLVRGQRAFCLQKMGRIKEALAIYNEIIKSEPTDLGLVAVASNNIITINNKFNLFDSKKRLRVILGDGVLPRLSRTQRRDIMINECIFHLHAMQSSFCSQKCEELAKTFPEVADTATEIKAALIAKDEGVKAVKDFINSLGTSNLSLIMRLKLGVIQFTIAGDQPQEAVYEMLSLGSDFYRPGIISMMVTLYHHAERDDEVAHVLEETVKHFKETRGNIRSITVLWQQLAALKMFEGNPKEAAKCLEELYEAVPEDQITLAHLIVVYSEFDIDKAKHLSKKLPLVTPPDLNLTDLESANWWTHVKFLKSGGKGDSAAATPADARRPKDSKPIKKKKKKAKLPANYDPNRHIDPERWLPRYERSGYRPKKSRKGRVDVGKGTQGADSGASAIYDMSGKVGQSRSAYTDESPGQTSGWRKDAHKKKKKRK